MQALKSSTIRKLWLDFWREKGHDILPSASLVPKNDPTLLWINSGVAAIKPYLDGSEVPENPRIANIQKCIRTNDIENVGHTARHQTLFEMLGNWSIGDYFKSEMLPWAWEFLTGEQWLALDPERLYITYYPNDTETLAIWRETTGLADEHFVALEDNIWDLGAGPSGPDTEIFYDRGAKYQNLPDDDPEMYPGGENERYLEIWNIVFSQWNHLPDDSYVDLTQKNIDTGMGVERIASVMQDTPTNFETDLFQPLIQTIEGLTDDIAYGADAKTDVSFKVIADHVRAVIFAIGDQALPSNDGAGYVLRRLIRRAIVHGRKLGITRAFLGELVPVVIETMGDFYPEISERKALIVQVLQQEESRFQATLADGEALLADYVTELKAKGVDTLAGETAFRLFDTYGFPLELTKELLAEDGLSVDEAGFDAAMQQQRERARAAREKVGGLAVQSTVLGDIDVSSTFVGYTETDADAAINALIYQDEQVETVPAGVKAELIAERTPFYAERGGQVGDTGMIFAQDGTVLARVLDVKHAPNGQNLHLVETKQPLHVGDTVHLAINKKRRRLIRKNHTATHLLHRALKDVLGPDVNQAGSLLDDQYLRFDFTYFGQVSAEQLQDVQQRVNEKIYASLPVKTELTTLEEAKQRGGMALFSDKYATFGEDKLRLVNIDDWSLELCGGTHVANTAEIGLFIITQESSVGSGVRRIEARTSKAALEYLLAREHLLNDLAQTLKVNSVTDVPQRVSQLEQELRDAKAEVATLRQRENQQVAGRVFDHVQTAGDYSYVAEHLPKRTMDDLRHMADTWKQQAVSDVLVLATDDGEKANLLVALSDAAVKQGLKAGDLIKPLAKQVGGGGGGRPNLAQAGGKHPGGIPQALSSVSDLLQNS